MQSLRWMIGEIGDEVTSNMLSNYNATCQVSPNCSQTGQFVLQVKLRQIVCKLDSFRYMDNLV